MNEIDGRHPSHADSGCLFPERWVRLESDISSIKMSTDQIHDKLFVGNGKEAWSVRIDRIERIVAVLIWAAGGLGAAGLLVFLGEIARHTWRAAT